MPLGWSSIVRHGITQSMTKLDIIVLYATSEGFIEALDKLDNLWENTIGSKYVPPAVSVYTVESLLEIYRAYGQPPLPFGALLNDVT